MKLPVRKISRIGGPVGCLAFAQMEMADLFEKLGNDERVTALRACATQQCVPVRRGDRRRTGVRQARRVLPEHDFSGGAQSGPTTAPHGFPGPPGGAGVHRVRRATARHAGCAGLSGDYALPRGPYPFCPGKDA
ncbi:hypothetical protein KDW40_09570 [Burkholderia cenocepacia]|uniref:hypothetical protein n=1 Tax=Burkholderia cenocepacia TaxID=95486 RepID=UPI001B9D847A|nr:hypothetical protein [Burkholderia cenocepacia]MBR8040723.1 hypothetical protein [Burkholderia cenocepacia]MBR8325980.1 hypothetical protein [Burkholderia cenocepacia]